MKLLVTGGLGFVGSNFCRNMITAQSDHEVLNVDKMGIGANPASLLDLEDDLKYSFVRGDICNPQLLKKTIRQVDAVINFAAETHVERSVVSPYVSLKNNTVGTFTILEALRKHNEKARLVQVSTGKVYGEMGDGSFTENHPPRPSNPYSASKAAADMLVNAYHKTYGLNLVITRSTKNYGPFQLPRKLIPKTIIRALHNLQIPIYGSGENLQEWIYVQDHCEAITLVLEKGVAGQIYNVSSGNKNSNLQIVKRILLQLDKPETLITFVEDRSDHDTRYSLDPTKIRSELGWKPKFPFNQTLESTINWYINNEKWWRPMATPRILNPTP